MLPAIAPSGEPGEPSPKWWFLCSTGVPTHQEREVDQPRRKGMLRALDYMGLKAGTPISEDSG